MGFKTIAIFIMGMPQIRDKIITQITLPALNMSRRRSVI